MFKKLLVAISGLVLAAGIGLCSDPPSPQSPYWSVPISTTTHTAKAKLTGTFQIYDSTSDLNPEFYITGSSITMLGTINGVNIQDLASSSTFVFSDYVSKTSTDTQIMAGTLQLPDLISTSSITSPLGIFTSSVSVVTLYPLITFDRTAYLGGGYSYVGVLNDQLILESTEAIPIVFLNNNVELGRFNSDGTMCIGAVSGPGLLNVAGDIYGSLGSGLFISSVTATVGAIATVNATDVNTVNVTASGEITVPTIHVDILTTDTTNYINVPMNVLFGALGTPAYPVDVNGQIRSTIGFVCPDGTIITSTAPFTTISSWTLPLKYVGTVASLNYNSVNLYVNGSDQLDTVQNINTGAVPTFAQIIITSAPTSGSYVATKDYVDSQVQSIIWKDPIISFWDASSVLPVGSSTTDRYACSVAGNGWLLNDIYQWNGATWGQYISTAGWAVLDLSDGGEYTFNGSVWVKFGSVSTHNNLSGKQGGDGVNQYYHLSYQQYLDALSVGSSTASLQGRVNAVVLSTGALQSQINDVIISTGAIQVALNSVIISTGSLQTQINNVIVSTGAIQTSLNSVIISTGAIQASLNAVILSTGTFVIRSGDTMTGTLNGTNLVETYGVKCSTFQMTAGAVNGYILQSDSGGNAVWGSSGVAAGSILSGSLRSSVTVSSIAVNAVYPAAVLAGTYSNITLPAANIAAGNLGINVICSSEAAHSVGLAQISAGGTPTATTFLDGSWNFSTPTLTLTTATISNLSVSTITALGNNLIFYSSDVYNYNYNTVDGSGVSQYWILDSSTDWGAGKAFVNVDTTTYFGSVALDSTTWVRTSTAPETHRYCGVATSYNGKVLVAGDVAGGVGYIYVSTNTGSTWVQKSTFPRNWADIAISSAGIIQAACVTSGYIYVSTDTGSNWVQKSTFTRTWLGIAMSADGSKITAIAASDYAWVSTNTGTTWTRRGGALGSTDGGIAMSLNGAIQLYASYNGYVCVSTDTGITWSTRTATGLWGRVAMSADGTLQEVLKYNYSLDRSTDSGSTWIETAYSGLTQVSDIAMSADGLIQLLGGYEHGYASSDGGSTWIESGFAAFANQTYTAVSGDGNIALMVGSKYSASLSDIYIAKGGSYTSSVYNAGPTWHYWGVFNATTSSVDPSSATLIRYYAQTSTSAATLSSAVPFALTDGEQINSSVGPYINIISTFSRCNPSYTMKLNSTSLTWQASQNTLNTVVDGVTVTQISDASGTLTETFDVPVIAASTVTVYGGFYPPQGASLPSSGYNEGCLFYNTTDKKLYHSTATVTSTGCWVNP